MQMRLFTLTISIAIFSSHLVIAQEPIEQRISNLEKRVSTLESQLDSLTKPSMGTTVSRKTTLSKEPIQLTLTSKTYSPANYTTGRYQDLISFEFDFVNNLSKSIRAFTGIAVFQDLFDRDILRVRLTIEEEVPPGKMGIWSGGIDYNQFMDEHQRLRSIQQKDLQLKFELESVIYSDGTKEKFGQQ